MSEKRQANNNKRNAIIWKRTSNGLGEANESLRFQEATCQGYAAKNGIRVIGVFESIGNDTILNDFAMKVLGEEEVNTILVSSFDRFSRSGTHGVAAKHYLKSMGIDVVSVSQTA